MRGNQIPWNVPGTGRMEIGNYLQGHFQDLVRQLTSPANWEGDPLSPQVAVLTVTQCNGRCRSRAILPAVFSPKAECKKSAIEQPHP